VNLIKLFKIRNLIIKCLGRYTRRQRAMRKKYKRGAIRRTIYHKKTYYYQGLSKSPHGIGSIKIWIRR